MSHKNSSLRPMAVSSAVIALECADKHVYIQASQDLSRDLCHHEQGTGSLFTKQHPFTGNILTVEMFSDDLQQSASRLAEEYIAKGYSVCNEFELAAEELAEILVMRMQPVTLTVQTYVLLCKPLAGNDYCTVYVGKTMNLTARIYSTGKGRQRIGQDNTNRSGLKKSSCVEVPLQKKWYNTKPNSPLSICENQ